MSPDAFWTTDGHPMTCRCAPCNPKSCDAKHPTKQHWCDLDAGHDGPHNDYEDMFQWTHPRDDSPAGGAA